MSWVYFFSGLETHGLSLDEIYKISGDSSDYVESVEGLIEGNELTFFKTSDDTEFVSTHYEKEGYNKGIYYAFRSPGFAFFYYPLRILFSQHTSLCLFLLFQVVFSGIAKYYLAKLGGILTNNKYIKYAVFLILNLTPFFVGYNNLLLTESFAFSLLIFFLYYFIKSLGDSSEELNYKYLIISGICLSVSVMLRPFLAIFFVSTGIFLIVRYYNNLKKLITVGFIFCIPFGVIDGSWIIRNFIKTEKIIPLASTMEFQDHKHLAFSEMLNFAKQRGVSDRWFDKESPVYWLISIDDVRGIDDLVKDLRIAESEKLLYIKKLFHESLNHEITHEKRKKLETLCLNELSKINKTFYAENSFLVEYQQPSQSLINLLSQPNKRFFHSILYPVNVILVFFQSVIIKWLFVIGIISSLLTFFLIKRNKLIILFVPPSIFLVLFFGWVHQSNEFRELYTYSSFFLLCPFLVISSLKKLKHKMLFIIFSSGVSLYLGFYQMIEEINW